MNPLILFGLVALAVYFMPKKVPSNAEKEKLKELQQMQARMAAQADDSV